MSWLHIGIITALVIIVLGIMSLEERIDRLKELGERLGGLERLESDLEDMRNRIDAIESSIEREGYDHESSPYTQSQFI